MTRQITVVRIASQRERNSIVLTIGSAILS